MDIKTEADSSLLNKMMISGLPQIFICLCGVFSLVWAFLDPRFRDAEGFLQGEFCLPIAIGIALLVLGCAITGRLRRPAFWFSLALVGQAVALQMIEAGPHVGYQHYKLSRILSPETHSFLLVYFAVQTAFVFAGLKSRWASIRSWITSHFKGWQLVGVGLVFLLTGAAPSRSISFYIFELLFAAFVQVVNLGCVVLMVWTVPDNTVAPLKRRFAKFFATKNEKHSDRNGRFDSFPLVAAIWVTGIATFLSIVVYERHPHVPDEVIYLFHARYFAEGALTVQAPPVPEAFSFYMIPHESHRWYSIFPPGWPAILSIGVLLGIPFLVNPLLAGVNVLLAHAFIRRIYDRGTARLVVILLCVSPWFVFMAMNFMSHTFTLTCVLIAAIALVRARDSGKFAWGCLAGVMTGFVGLIRPLDGIIVALLLGLWAVCMLKKRLPISSVAGFAFSAVTVAVIVFPYNKKITGHFVEFPLTAYYETYFGPKANSLGFGPERGLGWAIDPLPGHTPFEALINANLNAFSVNSELFGWSTGSLIVLAILLFCGAMRGNDYLMLYVIGAVLLGYSLYWFSGGPDFGARYWYIMILPLVSLTARGIEHIRNNLNMGAASQITNGSRVTVAVLSLCFFAFVNYFPWRALDKYHHYRGMRPEIYQLAKQYGFGKSLVLVRSAPGVQTDYLSAWAYNPLDPYADAPIYAWDRNPDVRTELLKAYSDRPVWIVNGPSLTQRGYVVVDGPLLANDPPKE